jgi:hypothetical protein
MRRYFLSHYIRFILETPVTAVSFQVCLCGNEFFDPKRKKLAKRVDMNKEKAEMLIPKMQTCLCDEMHTKS